MANPLTDQADPDGTLAARRELLEFEHKQTLDIGKFFYDGLFKLAPMSFVLNGILLSALAFLVKDAGKASTDFLLVASCLVGWIGVIYNVGAACACISLAITVWRLTERFNEIDRQLGLGIAACKGTPSNVIGSISWALTMVFFALWTALWVFLIVNRDALIQAGVGR